MFNRAPNTQQVEINLAGSSVFGRYPKISTERTFNMLISDEFLVPYSGYQKVIQNLNTFGRAIFTSTVSNIIVAVIGNTVYRIFISYNPVKNTYDYTQIPVGTLTTSSLDFPVFIAEDNGGHIAITDYQNIYIYTPSLGTFYIVAWSVDNKAFQPGYITFHDSRFEVASIGTNQWRLSDFDTSTPPLVIFPYDAQHVGTLETKPDNVQAVVRLPGKGNTVLVMGNVVTEFWTDVGGQLFPYSRNQSANIDYGCLNPNTVAYMDEIVVWLAANEKSGPIIMYCSGGGVEKITTDGIDYELSNLSNPSNAEGFLYRQDGHLIYHINFYTDNFSLFYDFNTKKFFNACDENGNYYIASDVCFFNNQYYFVTPNNGNIYALDTIYTDYDGIEIPRTRVCRNVRLQTQEYFIANDVGFTIEQGQFGVQPAPGEQFFLLTEDGDFIITESGDFIVTAAIIPVTNVLGNARVDLAISIDGGETFGNYVGIYLNPLGKRKNKLQWWRLGAANDMVCQFRFYGFQRFVCTSGIMNVHQ